MDGCSFITIVPKNLRRKHNAAQKKAVAVHRVSNGFNDANAMFSGDTASGDGHRVAR